MLLTVIVILLQLVFSRRVFEGCEDIGALWIVEDHVSIERCKVIKLVSFGGEYSQLVMNLSSFSQR